MPSKNIAIRVPVSQELYDTLEEKARQAGIVHIYGGQERGNVAEWVRQLITKHLGD